MKNLRKKLSILTSLGFITTVGVNVIACSCTKPQQPKEKIDLTTIKTLTGLTLVADSSKKFKDFDNQIIQANEFKQHPLAIGYILKYYFSKNKLNIIKNDTNQKLGNYFIRIQANVPYDPYWTGITDFIEIVVNK